jgi:very-short-patch-repair endonuclease
VAGTIVDLADVVGLERLARAVRESEILRLLDRSAIGRVLERVPCRAGRGRLRTVLTAYAPDEAFTRSGEERRFLRMCDQYGLTRPQTNLWVHEQEVDFPWPDARLAVELDGGPWHQTVSAFQEDRVRDRARGRYGIQVNRVTSEDLKRPAALSQELKEIRAARLLDAQGGAAAL